MKNLILLFRILLGALILLSIWALVTSQAQTLFYYTIIALYAVLAFVSLEFLHNVTKIRFYRYKKSMLSLVGYLVLYSFCLVVFLPLLSQKQEEQINTDSLHSSSIKTIIREVPVYINQEPIQQIDLQSPLSDPPAPLPPTREFIPDNLAPKLTFPTNEIELNVPNKSLEIIVPEVSIVAPLLQNKNNYVAITFPISLR